MAREVGSARARELVMWERERLGGERLAWLASLPEHVAFSGGRLEDLVAVHGVPGNPFVPFLARPGEDRSPWVQSDARVRELLAGLDADMVVCGHTHTPLLRQVDRTLDRQPRRIGLRPRRQHRRRPGGLCAAGLVGCRGLARLVSQRELRSRTIAPSAAGVARRLSCRRVCRQPHAPVAALRLSPMRAWISCATAGVTRPTGGRSATHCPSGARCVAMESAP